VGYMHPVLVYVPPGGELRGGAWVVIDPTINEDQMEMFVDPSARGGILEPAGIVEIKYRKAQILATMGRLDPEIAALNLQLASAADDERRKVAGLLKQRQEQLLPHYLKVAEQYADLHDVPARMLAKVLPLHPLASHAACPSVFCVRSRVQKSAGALHHRHVCVCTHSFAPCTLSGRVLTLVHLAHILTLVHLAHSDACTVSSTGIGAGASSTAACVAGCTRTRRSSALLLPVHLRRGLT